MRNMHLLSFALALLLPISCSSHAQQVMSGRITFVSDRDDNLEIYVTDPQGQNFQNLTNHPADDKSPDWSPDGNTLVFVSDRDNSNDEIFVMDANGSSLRNLTNNAHREAQPTWSPDGQQIAFVSLQDTSSDIYLINIDGSGLRNLTNDDAHDVTPIWSPDGASIAYSSQGEEQAFNIMVLELNTLDQRNLTNSSEGFYGPIWSPDGSYLAFISMPDFRLHITLPDGSALRTLNDYPINSGVVSWSPDGSLIAFSSQSNSEDADIFLLKVSDLTITQLSQEGISHYYPEWSPDGRHIVSISDDDGVGSLFIQSIDGQVSDRLDITTFEFSSTTSPEFWFGQQLDW